LKVNERGKRYVLDALNNNRLSRGKYTAQLERQFAELHEAKHSIFCNSGTSALQISLAALRERHGYEDGDEVLVPATTFISTSNIVLQNRMQPAFVDVDAHTYNIDPNRIEERITPRTRAMIPVHLFGLPCDMEPILDLARRYNLHIIEDSAETMFAKYHGRAVGSFGDLACFSTYVTHLIVGGVGGLVASSDDELAIMCRSLMAHGRDHIYLNIDDDDQINEPLMEQIVKRRFNFVRVGYSYRATELEAAIALSELEGWVDIIGKRRKNAARLTELLRPFEEHIQLPTAPPGVEHSFMLYPLVAREHVDRDQLLLHLERQGIETRHLFPLLSQPVYQRLFPGLAEQYPVARRLGRSGFFIGIHQGLEEEHLKHIATAFGEYFELAKGRRSGQKSVSAKHACRSCGSSSLAPVLQLGDFYIADFVDSPGASLCPKIPLELLLCQDCTLLQLRHTTPPEWLYRRYWYRSGINSSMRTALADITRKAESLASLRPGDSVLDIGCNDGTLLRSYTTPGIRRAGFEPAQNLVAEARIGTDHIINDFFSQAAIAGEKFRVITSIAMFYDLEEPNSFVADVGKSLAPDGIWVIEMHYLPLMLSQNAFDAICHEHLEYYSLSSLLPLLEQHGMAVLDVETNMINGGSFRIYVHHAGSSRSAWNGSEERVERMLAEEERLGLTGRQIYEDFAARVLSIREKVCRFLQEEISQGKKIYVYGASTKGNTILQYFGLDHRTIRAAAERNPDKWGKYTAGTGIPILSEEEARREADDFLVLPWHFGEEFQMREQAFLARGGKLIIPLPAPRIIDRFGETQLARIVATGAGSSRSSY